jgi:hypothetical protein
MNDDQLKHDIEEALSVNPSPEFTARVRTRIAAIKEGSRTSAAWIRWSIAGAGLTAAAIMIVVVVSEPAETLVPQPMPIARVAPELEEEVPATPAPEPIKEATKAREPEILIDPREAVALRKFVEGAQKNRIDVGQLIALQRQATRSLIIEDIALMPLDTLEPIVIAPLSSEVRSIEGESL